MGGNDAFETHRRLLGGFEAAESYRFVRTANDDQQLEPWQLEVAQKYYSKLFREYAIVDLSRYKEGLLGCRWRTHQEVIDGKGQFICGAKSCQEQRYLQSSEVPFVYKENKTLKNTLVKVRLCPRHLDQLDDQKLRMAPDAKKEGGHGKKRSRRCETQESDEGRTVKAKHATQKVDLRGEQPSSPGTRVFDSHQEADAFLAQLLL